MISICANGQYDVRLMFTFPRYPQAPPWDEIPDQLGAEIVPIRGIMPRKRPNALIQFRGVNPIRYLFPFLPLSANTAPDPP